MREELDGASEDEAAPSSLVERLRKEWLYQPCDCNGGDGTRVVRFFLLAIADDADERGYINLAAFYREEAQR